jgi:uncharacterized repeat protein (TIGR03803 family)
MKCTSRPCQTAIRFSESTLHHLNTCTLAAGEGALALTQVLRLAMMLLVLGISQAEAQTYTSLYSFTGQPDGAYANSALTRSSAGNLYGTTTLGGSGPCSGNQYVPGCGTVFKVGASGKETVLHSFTGAPDDGAYPQIERLLRDSAGNLYGTTNAGGTADMGTVFMVDKHGKETVLHSFLGTPDGDCPIGGLIRDADGNLYGTTAEGGTFDYGTVFKLDTTGTVSVLYSFTGGADGGEPSARLVKDASGNFYSTASSGGTYNLGTVFKLSRTGKETVLYNFTGGADGTEPGSFLVRDSAGNLYGTTTGGGNLTNCGGFGCGVVFKVDKLHKETVLHTFTGYLGKDGQWPEAGLVLDSAGNLYGTTTLGTGRTGRKSNPAGTVFKLDKTGKETLLYSFCTNWPSCPDGRSPTGGVILDPSGTLYGATSFGGTGGCTQPPTYEGCGLIFKLTANHKTEGR